MTAKALLEFYDPANWGAGFRQVDAAHPNGHNGHDIHGHEAGTWIPAVMPGVVVYKGYDPTYGNVVTVRSGDVRLYYCHQLNDAGLDVGTEVDFFAGVGPLGSTGYSTGPHLHLGASLSADRPALYRGLVDPKPYIQAALRQAGGTQPAVSGEEEFDMLTETQAYQLDQVYKALLGVDAAGKPVALNPGVNFGQSLMVGIQKTREGVQRLIDHPIDIDDLAAAIVEKLPAGTLTKDDVLAALRSITWEAR